MTDLLYRYRVLVTLAFYLFAWFGPAAWVSRWILRRRARRRVTYCKTWLREHPEATEDVMRTLLYEIEWQERTWLVRRTQ